MRKLICGMALSSLTLIAVPCANAENSRKDTVSVDASGTKVTTHTESSSESTLLGNRKLSEKESVSVDPKGLNNKMTTSKDRQEIVKDNGDYEVTESIKHANGTSEVNTESRDTRAHLMDSGKTVTSKRTASIDPKGLGNKVTAETEKTKTYKPDGSIDTEIVKRIDGDVVAKSKIDTE